MKKANTPDPETVVCAMYHFVTLPDLEAKRAPLQGLLDRHNLKGTLLLAKEGINGTVAGGQEGIDALLNWLRADQQFAGIKWKISYDAEPPFHRAKVKLKNEIVTMGVEHIDPRRIVGTYVPPADWNALIEDPDVTLIDTRNEYEIQIGSFRNALNPHTSTFRQFPDYVKKHLNPKKNKKVAMFCTGGIRCEKSTAFLKEQGFEEVYHLEGGILKYLEEVPEAESLWQGECFVFDNRVSVNHQLEPGQYRQCHGCRMPLSPEDMQSAAYVEGVSCHHCYQTQSAQRKARFKERQKQVQLANRRGESHIGADATKAHRERRERKLRRKQEDRNAEIERAVANKRPPE